MVVNGNMITEETVNISSKEVACDGGNGQLGHPKVFLHINNDNQVVCPYCSKKYVYKSQKS
jgi:uncharacterized Zn-finger protein